ncbi:MAG: NAD(P)/FAD-dependent oxidoreductase [Bryobacteraceae bacterium]
MEGALYPMPYDVVILGGGAAGLFGAFHATRRGRRVLVLESNDRPGRKILISGGGRCNFTNRDTRPECFLSANPHFAKSALARYTPRDFIALVERHGIAWHEKTLGQLFCDHSAQQILDMLLAECRDAGVEIRCSSRVAALSQVSGGFELQFPGECIRTASLIVATGGPSIPKMGATGFAYDIARQFGIRVIPPRPGLVPLTLNAPSPLAGVATDVRVSFGRRSFDERMLFTHRGLSGPAILQISSYWQPGQPLQIDLVPGLNITDALLAQKRDNCRSLPRTFLSQYLPERLASTWAASDPLLDRPLLQIADSTLRQLGQHLHRWQLTPAGTEGFEKAEVTAGGIDTAELSSQNMQARRVPGLFFIGECVDVTGWLGGYNFQWAWASAFAAAQTA